MQVGRVGALLGTMERSTVTHPFLTGFLLAQTAP